MKEHLLEKLKEYSQSDYYPLHMPGHKRRLSHFTDPFSLDITEIDGFDNLHHAGDLLLEAQRRAAELYKAEETWYLINGSTCGILAAVSACTRRGERILMARNCHKAAYHALLLNGLRAAWLYPQIDLKRGINCGISPLAVKKSMEEFPDIRVVLLTSPTYDGIVSDIQSIAEIVHRHQGVLIVDEAHGAHFVMHPAFPRSALELGADLVINSLHKTMPSLTQTALLHVKGNRVDRERIRSYLGIYQTSSPSYVLMAGMDACVDLMQKQGREMFDSFIQRLEELRNNLQRMQCLHLITGAEPEIGAFAFDRSKILISTERSGLSGAELAVLLREKYHLEAEMAAVHYLTAIMTVCDTGEGFMRLQQALLEIDEALQQAFSDNNGYQVSPEHAGTRHKTLPEYAKSGREIWPDQDRIQHKWIESDRELHQNESAVSLEKAYSAENITVPLEESSRKISAEFVYLYPPGIPLLIPGERIPEDLPEILAEYQGIGLQLQGLSDHSGKTIKVLIEESMEMR